MKRIKLVSPFIATIILVIITIAVGVVVYTYISTTLRSSTQQTSQVVSCIGGNFEITNFLKHGYGYYREITIKENSGIDLKDYQILIKLDTASLIVAGKMRSDCGDIRVLDESGKMLDYYIETGCNTPSTIIWIKVPLISASSTKKIYLVYGNPSATYQNDPNKVFDFFENFDVLDTSKWYINAQYTLSNSILNITKGSILLQNPLQFSLNSYYYIVEAGVLYGSNKENYYSGTLGVASSQKVAANNANSDAVVLYMLTNKANGNDAQVFIGSGATNSFDVANGDDVFTATLNRLYILGIEIKPSNVVIWKDFQRGKSYSLKWSKNLIYIILGDYTGGTNDIKDTLYDWIRIRKYVYPEPSVSIGSEKSLDGMISFNLRNLGTGSIGSIFKAIVYYADGSIYQKDIDIGCNLGSECMISDTIYMLVEKPINKIELCSKACESVCNEYKP
jgi:hypothetical protein